jgi:hypothetical protein
MSITAYDFSTFTDSIHSYAFPLRFLIAIALFINRTEPRFFTAGVLQNRPGEFKKRELSGGFRSIFTVNYNRF